MRKLIQISACAMAVLMTCAISAAEDAPDWRTLDTGVKHTVLAADYSKKRIGRFDESGAMVQEYPITDIHDLHILPNGNILTQHGWRKIVELTPAGDVVWSYDSGTMNGNEGKRVEVHAFQRLASGLTMIAESGPGRIIEVDQAGKIQHEVKLQVAKPDPHRDTRLVRKIEATGNYLVCHEGEGCVREYDAAGKVVWEFALEGDTKTFAHKGSGTAVFGAIRTPNGNTIIATGNGHSVIEVNPAKEVVWSLTSEDLKGIKLVWVTTLELLPNGNIVIGNCHAGPENPQIIEVTRDKKVVWAFHNFDALADATSNSQLADMAGKTIR